MHTQSPLRYDPKNYLPFDVTVLLLVLIICWLLSILMNVHSGLIFTCLLTVTLFSLPRIVEWADYKWLQGYHLHTKMFSWNKQLLQTLIHVSNRLKQKPKVLRGFLWTRIYLPDK